MIYLTGYDRLFDWFGGSMTGLENLTGQPDLAEDIVVGERMTAWHNFSVDTRDLFDLLFYACT